MGNKRKKKWWFKVLSGVLRIVKRKPTYMYLGDEIKDPSVILSNHVGTDGPLSFELFAKDNSFRFWGTYEMNENLKTNYKYLSETYYHQKHNWNLFISKVFCLLASPVSYMFYKGLDLIPTYQDQRLRRTIRESEKVLNNNQSVIIFPEDSSKGYFDNLTHFFSGYALLLDTMLKKGKDIPVVVSYYKKKDKVRIIDKPVMYSVLKSTYKTKEELSKYLLDRCNELGRMKFDKKTKTLIY